MFPEWLFRYLSDPLMSANQKATYPRDTPVTRTRLYSTFSRLICFRTQAPVAHV